LVGVVNKRRGRMTVYPAETGGVFKLQMSAAGLGDAGAAAVSAPSTDRARQDLLISDFGSRKKQKMEVSRQANIVNVRAVAAVGEVSQHLQAASLGAEASREAAGASDGLHHSTGESKAAATLLASRVATLPPFNADASSPHEAYPLGGIISQAVFAELEAPAKSVVRAMEGRSPGDEQLLASLSFGSQFVTDRLRKLLELSIERKSGGGAAAADSAAGDGSGGGAIRKSAAKARAASLVYLGALLLLHRAPATLRFSVPAAAPQASTVVDGEAPAAPEALPDLEPRIHALRGVPAAVVSDLLTRFTEERPASEGGAAPSLYIRSPELRDRLVAHAAVLSLIVDGFVTDSQLLAADLRMTPAKVAQMYREAGCAVEPIRDSAGGGTVVSYRAQLKTPLTFPKLKLNRR
jgi:hypothetical protein